MKRISTRFLIFSILLFFTLTSFSQASSQPGVKQCKEYKFRDSSFKLKIYLKDRIFDLQEVLVDDLDTLFFTTLSKKCDDPIPIIFDDEPLEVLLKKRIEKGFPSKKDGLGVSLKMRIRDMEFRNNLLPSSNPRLYLTVDFLDKAATGNYRVVYSSTYYTPITRALYLEPQFARLIKSAIKDFTIKQRYLVRFYEVDSDSESFIYNSFENLKANDPTYSFDYGLEPDTVNTTSIVRYRMINRNKKLDTQFFAIRHEGKLYLNVDMYYPKGYYSLLEDLDNDYYFMFDQVFDYTKASNATIASGGGLLGAAVGTASTTREIPALIDKKTGVLRAFSNKVMQEILEGYSISFEHYKELLREEKFDQIKLLFINLNQDKKLDKTSL